MIWIAARARSTGRGRLLISLRLRSHSRSRSVARPITPFVVSQENTARRARARPVSESVCLPFPSVAIRSRASFAPLLCLYFPPSVSRYVGAFGRGVLELCLV